MADLPRIAVTSRNSEWQFHAACRGLGDDLFYTHSRERGPTKRRRENMAKAVCATCFVVEACRAWALTAGERYGVWGGLTVAERVQIEATAETNLGA